MAFSHNFFCMIHDYFSGESSWFYQSGVAFNQVLRASDFRSHEKDGMAKH